MLPFLSWISFLLIHILFFLHGSTWTICFPTQTYFISKNLDCNIILSQPLTPSYFNFHRMAVIIFQSSSSLHLVLHSSLSVGSHFFFSTSHFTLLTFPRKCLGFEYRDHSFSDRRHMICPTAPMTLKHTGVLVSAETHGL